MINIISYSKIKKILTMDDWCAAITRRLIRNAQESALPFVIFIFIANYILLNIMLAISCDQMKEVSHQQRIFEGECDSVSSFSIKSFDFKDFTIKHSLFTVLSNVLKILEFSHNYFYSKLIREHKLKELCSHKICSDKQNELELYFLLNELRNANGKENFDSEEFFIEYRGKIVNIKAKKLMVRINENAELYVHTKNSSMAERQRGLLQNEIKKIVRKKSMISPNGEKIEEDLENETENLIKKTKE